MTKGYVVVGAGFGDEGKGKIVDYLTRKFGAKTVVRFNGGGQAGHTVVTPHQQRHVFKTASAGTLAGASTYLSKDFIFNPYLLEKEIDALKKIGVSPTIYCHPEAIVTTIFDMAVNTLAEMHRGNNRHGSCGVGINETVTREDFGFSLTVNDLDIQRPGNSLSALKSKLKNIRERWVPQRLKFLCGTEDLPDVPAARVLRDTDYDYHAARLLAGVRYITITQKPVIGDVIVMEGAQGLALDEQLGEFPHVTRSLTGLPNAIKAALELGITELQPIYVTRAYATRHGAGPFNHEGEPITEETLTDDTNAYNKHQGIFRYAPLDLKQLEYLIEQDLLRALRYNRSFLKPQVELLEPVLAVTCLDQLGSKVSLYDVAGNLQRWDRDYVVGFIQDELSLPVALESWGKTHVSTEQHINNL